MNILWLAGLSLFSIFMVSLIALHVLRTEVDWKRDPVSNYALSRYGYLYAIQSISAGVTVFIIMNMTPASSWPLGLIVYGVSRILIPIFKTDVKDEKTFHGVVHAVLAVATFAGISIGSASYNEVNSQILTHGINMSLFLFSLAMKILTVIFYFIVISRIGYRFKGGVERALYLSIILWMACALCATY